MDINLVVLCGRVAVPPEHHRFDSGGSQLRILLTVQSEGPTRRIELIPVALWNPSDELADEELEVGTRVWISGTLQRRFGESDYGPDRRSRIDVVAQEVRIGAAADDVLIV